MSHSTTCCAFVAILRWDSGAMVWSSVHTTYVDSICFHAAGGGGSSLSCTTPKPIPRKWFTAVAVSSSSQSW